MTDVAIAGAEVTLTLGTAVAADDTTVTVTYTAPQTDPIQNPVGNDAEGFMNEGVEVRNPLGVTVAPTKVEAIEGGATGSYTVVLKSQPTDTVTVTVGDTSDDIAASPTTLTFTTVNWNTAQTVTVTADDDNVAEGEETATLTHAVTSTDSNYGTVTTADRRDGDRRRQRRAGLDGDGGYGRDRGGGRGVHRDGEHRRGELPERHDDDAHLRGHGHGYPTTTR